MYQSYWQLKSRPFEGAVTGRGYYPSESHQGALLKLRYAIENRRGAALLAGAAGTGKTLLARLLAEQLSEKIGPFVPIVFPLMSSDQLLAYFAAALTNEAAPSMPGLAQSVRQIERALAEHAQAGRHVTAVFDEAQLLADSGALETLRLLLNFEHRGKPCLTLLLVGQSSLLSALENTPEFDSRIEVKCLLRPFTWEETLSYVHHRLAIAGASRPIFDDGALEAIHRLSHGVPRAINRLCDMALLIGYGEERAAVSATHVEAVSAELAVSAEV